MLGSVRGWVFLAFVAMAVAALWSRGVLSSDKPRSRNVRRVAIALGSFGVPALCITWAAVYGSEPELGLMVLFATPAVVSGLLAWRST